MFNYLETETQFDELCTAQADRLLKSGMNTKMFLAQPQEVAAAAEIARLNALLTEIELSAKN